MVPRLTVVIALAACSACSSAPSSGGAAPVCGTYAAVVAASDYEVESAIGAFTTSDQGTITGGIDLGADPALAFSNGRVFFIARDDDFIAEVDPSCGTLLANTHFSTHDAARMGTTDPQDVAAASDGTLFIPRFDEPSILILDKSGKAVASIDTSTFDSDGNPNASSARIASVGGVEKAFVTLERLDDADPTLASKQPSWMLVIDVATHTVDKYVVLAGQNPFGLMVEEGGVFFLAEPGNFNAINEPLAGIERFDPSTETTALIVPETALGASVAQVSVSPDGACGAAIIADATPGVNHTSLVTFDPVSGAVLTSAATPVFGPTANYDLQAMAWKGDVLFVGDRSGAQPYPVHIFDRSGTCTLTERAASVSLPQKPVAFVAIN